jgi:hypothetical protein
MHRGAYACHPITCWSFPDSEEARGIAARGRSDGALQIGEDPAAGLARSGSSAAAEQTPLRARSKSEPAHSAITRVVAWMGLPVVPVGQKIDTHHQAQGGQDAEHRDHGLHAWSSTQQRLEITQPLRYAR